jgi:heptosyltransferase-2
LIRPRSLSLKTTMHKQVRHILVIRLSSLGDVVLTTPALTALKKKLPQSHIFFLTKAQYVDLLRNDPRVSSLMEFDPVGKHRGLSGFRRLISQLRSYDFDLMVDLHSNLRSLLIRRLVKSKTKLKYNKRWLSRFLMVRCKFMATTAVQTVECYLEVLKRIQIEAEDKNPTIFTGQDEAKFAGDFLLERRVGKDDIMVGVSPGARWETKRWAEGKFQQVCRTLIERFGYKILLLGDVSEQRLIEGIEKESPEGKVLKAVGTPLGKLMGLVERCACLVTNDSGPMHLASALGVPVVAIFGPTHPKLGFAPAGSPNVVLCADVDCSPCSLHGERRCRKKSRFCMDLIQPERVVEAVGSLLEEKKSVAKGT